MSPGSFEASVRLCLQYIRAHFRPRGAKFNVPTIPSQGAMCDDPAAGERSAGGHERSRIRPVFHRKHRVSEVLGRSDKGRGRVSRQMSKADCGAQFACGLVPSHRSTTHIRRNRNLRQGLPTRGNHRFAVMKFLRILAARLPPGKKTNDTLQLRIASGRRSP